MTGRTPHSASLLLVPAGFAIWAVAFSLLYAAQAVGCAFGWSPGIHRTVLLLIWAVHVAAVAALLVYCVRLPRGRSDDMRGFLRATSIGCTIAALAATVLIGLMIPVISLCR
jgi:hypothetical protein